MYAGVSHGGEIDFGSPIDIPEWKRLLIMRKRAGGGNLSAPDEQARALRNGGPLSNGTASRNGGYAGKFPGARPLKPVDNGLHFEATPPRTVTRTIGNINVELRSVSTSDSPEFSFSTDGSSPRVSNSFCESYSVAHDSEDDAADDLQYGPGIVDRLRARFLNMGDDKKSRKPVVRRFSSLENLPGSHSSGPHRLRGIRQNGKSSVFGGHHQGHVKKAQSMETLLSSTPEQPIVVRRAGNVRGVKGRMTFGRNASWVSDENDEPDGKGSIASPNPEVPKRSWDYTRSVSAPSINEDELPKPDTVKQVKKMFESPAVGAADRSGNATGVRFRKVATSNVSGKIAACNGVSMDPFGKVCNGAIAGSGGPPRHSQLTKVQVETNDIEEVSEEDSETAKLTSAKDEEDSVDSDFADDVASDGTEYDPPADEIVEPPSYHLVNGAEIADDLSPANGARETLIAEADDNADLKFKREESEESFIVVCEAAEVTPERLPFAERATLEEEVSFQPREDLGREGAEQRTLVADVSPDDVGGEQTMVVASSAAALQKPWAVKKTPQSTTSVVFDFRGTDVKPNISLNPTPFGCRPAKVSRRAGSPPEGSGGALRVNGDAQDYLDDDWDEMDIGADLPAVCGIEFDGENVKVGRGALLETRNKKLTIQFDDGATSTFEYPSELDSPSDENGRTSPPAIAMDSPANARLGLSNYTPHVLSSDKDFELGVSRPSQRPMKPLPKVPTEEEVTTPDDIVPAEEAAVWSSAETTDILF